jgi:hypothetical protein
MVGNNPQTVPAVIGAEGARWYAIPLAVIPALGQLSEYRVHVSVGPSKQPWDVLQQKVVGSYLANDTDCLWPKIPIVFRCFPLPNDAEWLARKPCADDINVTSPWGAVEGPDIVPDWEPWQDSVSLSGEQNPSAEGINLNSADGAPSKQLGCQDAASCPCI